MASELKPCPFCGTAPVVEGDDIGCPNPRCIYVFAEKGTLEASRAAWNTRPEPSADGPGQELWAVKGPAGEWYGARPGEDAAWSEAQRLGGMSYDRAQECIDQAKSCGYRAVRVRLVEIPEPAELADGGEHA